MAHKRKVSQISCISPSPCFSSPLSQKKDSSHDWRSAIIRISFSKRLSQKTKNCNTTRKFIKPQSYFTKTFKKEHRNEEQRKKSPDGILHCSLTAKRQKSIFQSFNGASFEVVFVFFGRCLVFTCEHRHTDTHRHTHRHTYRHTHTHRHTHIHTHRYTLGMIFEVLKIRYFMQENGSSQSFTGRSFKMGR